MLAGTAVTRKSSNSHPRTNTGFVGGTQQGRETLHGFEKSADKLGVEHIDLLILRQALPYT